MIAKRPFTEGTKLPVSGVSLDLSIPHFGIEASKPISKCLQFLRSEASDLTFDILNAVHTKPYRQLYRTVYRFTCTIFAGANPLNHVADALL